MKEAGEWQVVTIPISPPKRVWFIWRDSHSEPRSHGVYDGLAVGMVASVPTSNYQSGDDFMWSVVILSPGSEFVTYPTEDVFFDPAAAYERAGLPLPPPGSR